MEEFRNLGIRGAEGIEGAHHSITKKVQSSKVKVLSSSEILNFLYYFVSLSVYDFKKNH